MVGRTIPNNDEISNALCSHWEGAYFFSQKNTDEQNTQRPERWWPLPLPLPRREGEWLPRYPYGLDVGFVLSLISFENSSNVLWYLYAGGVLWDRNCAQMRSVTSVSSVRERNTLCERERYSLWEKRISSVRERTPLHVRKNSPPCEKELPKKSWCKEIKSPKAYLIIKPPLPRFKNMLFSIREHAL